MTTDAPRAGRGWGDCSNNCALYHRLTPFAPNHLAPVVCSAPQVAKLIIGNPRLNLHDGPSADSLLLTHDDYTKKATGRPFNHCPRGSKSLPLPPDYPRPLFFYFIFYLCIFWSRIDGTASAREKSLRKSDSLFEEDESDLFQVLKVKYTCRRTAAFSGTGDGGWANDFDLILIDNNWFE